jgi:DNA-binding sugar fermentation-stimulating protein
LFVARNIQIKNIEVDLLMIAPSGELTIIEVKSAGEFMVWQNPVCENQRKRLRKVLGHLQIAAEKGARAHLAAVNHKSEVTVFADFLSENDR